MVLATISKLKCAHYWLSALVYWALTSTIIVFAHENDDIGLHMSKDRALREVAFPESDRIERRTLFLKPVQLKALSERSYSKITSKLQTVYVGWTGDVISGYAVINTDIVRSKAATFMIILKPDGTLSDFRILAWQEPPEYEPPQRWLDRFIGLDLNQSPVRIGQGVDAISGATLSVRMLAEHARQALALYDIVLDKKESAAD